jgi:uncharacterized small protein (DUF1192 family)
MTQKEAILAVLKRASGPMVRADILDQVQDLGHGWRRDAVASTLTVLQRRGLIGHPAGDRNGWQLTEAGRAADIPTLVQGVNKEEDEYDDDYLEVPGEEDCERPQEDESKVEQAEALQAQIARHQAVLVRMEGQIRGLEQRVADTRRLDALEQRVDQDTPPHDCGLVSHTELDRRVSLLRKDVNRINDELHVHVRQGGEVIAMLRGLSLRRWAADSLAGVVMMLRGEG